MQTYNQSRYFDFGGLKVPDLQFGILADSHYTEGNLAGGNEFPSRKLQGKRIDVILDLLPELPLDFLIHMGDLTQEYPESPNFRKSFKRIQRRFEMLPFPVHYVAGNHDIGDKPDATMPTHPVNEDKLTWYHEQCGQSWYTFTHGGCRFFIVNSQIFNTGLDAEKKQRDWLENQLAESEESVRILFFHLPLCLGNCTENGLGNYDVIDHHSREWLSGLIQNHRIDFVGSAHVHFSFFCLLGSAEYHQFTSPAFTRPGFSHLFSAAPPEEQGRNDVAKLGLYMIRVMKQKPFLHFIRTYGVTERQSLIPAGSRLMLHPMNRRTPAISGVTLLEPLTWETEIPLTFPSVTRQRISNNYPFYLIQEAGIAHLRLPVGDLRVSTSRDLIQYLLEKGGTLTVIILAEKPLDEIPSQLGSLSGRITIEWQLPGRISPDMDTLRSLKQYCAEKSWELSLAPVIPGELISGKQHPRTRTGYDSEEWNKVRPWLTEHNLVPDRILLKPEDNAWARFKSHIFQTSPEPIPALDFRLVLSHQDDARNARDIANAYAWALPVPSSRIFFEPFTDLDRTMDVASGLCDRLHNPRRAYSVLKSLNTLFFPESGLTATGKVRTSLLRSDDVFIQTKSANFILVQSAESLTDYLTQASGLMTQFYELSRGLTSEAPPVHFEFDGYPVLIAVNANPEINEN